MEQRGARPRSKLVSLDLTTAVAGVRDADARVRRSDKSVDDEAFAHEISSSSSRELDGTPHALGAGIMTNTSVPSPAIATLSSQTLCARALALEKFVHAIFFGRGMKRYRDALEATTFQLSRIAGRARAARGPSREGHHLDRLVEKLGDLRMIFESFHDADGIGDREMEEATSLLVDIESVAHEHLSAIEAPRRRTTRGAVAAPDAGMHDEKAESSVRAAGAAQDQRATGDAPLVDHVSGDRTGSIAAMTSLSLDIERTTGRRKKKKLSANAERRQSRRSG